MLRQMSARDLIEWQCYAETEPFGEERADWRLASIASLMANINRDPKKRPQAYEMKDFLLKFEVRRPKRTQTWQETKSMAQLIAAMWNGKDR